MTGVTFSVQLSLPTECELPLFLIFPLHQQLRFFEPNESFFDMIAEYYISTIAVYFAPLECDLSCPSQRREDNESGSWTTDRPDIPATPFTQLAEEKRQYGGLMFYGLSALAKL